MHLGICLYKGECIFCLIFLLLEATSSLAVFSSCNIAKVLEQKTSALFRSTVM